MSAVHDLAGCARPLRLLRTAVDTTTGDVSSREVLRRCGSRRASDCPACSSLYQGDALAVVRSGVEADEAGEFTWITLTAPGAKVFGRVHSQRRDGKGRIRPCACRRRHLDGDRLIGTPVDPAAYRYDLAASFNGAASRLFSVTIQKLRRILGRPLAYVRVAEFQRRGLVHIHVLVRGRVERDAVALAVLGGGNPSTGYPIKPSTSSGWRWGDQFDVTHVRPGAGRGLAAYMVKLVRYAVKSAGDDLASTGDHARRMERAAERGCSCTHAVTDCRAGHPYHDHVQWAVDGAGAIGTVAKRFPYLAKAARSVCRKHRAAIRGWGHRGHVFSASPGWGVRFSELRAQRVAWAAGSQSQPASLVVTWAYLGRLTLGLVGARSPS